MPTTDAYGLDPERDWEGMPECEGTHTWGPWVLSPVYSNREDRFCVSCGMMEMQTVE